MKITLLQHNIDWCAPEENRRRVERLLEGVAETNLCVMAEMFTTGFCMNPAETAEKAERGQTLEWMRCMAVERHCALAGSVAVEAGGRYYNRLYFVFPDGSWRHYDKRHLFTYGGEQRVYTPGSERVVVEYMGVRILLQVCYDLRFPVWARNRQDYDVALYVASWPASRIRVWDTLLCARALENQCYVVGVNRTGEDPLCGYCGHSTAVDPYGKVVASATDEETALTFTVDMERLQAFRKKFPVLEDGDCFSLCGE